MMKIRNTVFVVTETFSCPLYTVGDEFIMQNSTLTVADGKKVCLLLMQEVFKILDDTEPLEQMMSRRCVSTNFECSGCNGALVRFKRKKAAVVSCLPMNQLKATEPREEHQVADQLVSILCEMELFEPLNEIELQELALLMKVTQYPADTVIFSPNDQCAHFCIVLTGKVEIIKDGSCAELGPGGTFGEMSLFSSEAACSFLVCTQTPVQLACLNAQDIKRTLASYPNLQVFFYRLLVKRTQSNCMSADCLQGKCFKEDAERCLWYIEPKDKSSFDRMSGELNDYINLVDLFQIINTGGKTGKIDLTLPDGKARVLFHDGEIIQSSFGPLQGKEALFALLAQQNSSFTYSNGLTEEEKVMPILGGFVGLLMEGLLYLDERDKMQQDRPF